MSSTPSPADAAFEITHLVRDTCLCLHAQKAARALARRFDVALKPVGITSGQFLTPDGAEPAATDWSRPRGDRAGNGPDDPDREPEAARAARPRRHRRPIRKTGASACCG
jgi:hypothetical protein